MANRPMAAIRQLIRDQTTGLHVIDALGSIGTDVMIGAGSVGELTFAMCSLEAFGLAPHFRRAIQDGELRYTEVSGVAISVALEAAARKLPFLPMRDLGGSELPAHAPAHYGEVICPFTGESLMAMRALEIDVALIHVLRADPEGNCQTAGPLANDVDYARAAKRVIVTCEEVVDRGRIAESPGSTHIPGFLVDAVIEAPFGAHPTSHVPRYSLDAQATMDYANACSAGEGDAYIRALASEDESAYVERMLDQDRRRLLMALAAGFSSTVERV
jgi:glutaconate CoA-transferase subunit A